MSRLPAANLKRTDERVRWFLGFVEVQTGQSQPIIGTPTDVPVPRKTSVRAWLMGK